MQKLTKLLNVLLHRITKRLASHSPEDDEPQTQHYVEILQENLGRLPPESDTETRIKTIEFARNTLTALQAKQLAAFDAATLKVGAKQLEMLPVSGLWHMLKTKTFAFLRRYWLLLSRPRLYFDVYIKDAKASDLWHTFLHSIYVASALAGLISFLLLFYTTEDKAALSSIVGLADKSALYAFLVWGVLPSFLISFVIYRVVRARISDLFFIYVNFITLSLLLSILFVPVIPGSYIVRLLVPFVDHGTNRDLSWWAAVVPFFALTLVLFSLIVTMIVACYYVPVALIEKSTGRSALFSTVFLVVAVATPYLINRAYGVFSKDPQYAGEAVPQPPVSSSVIDERSRKLVLASYSDQIKVVQSLIAEGVDVNAKVDGATALFVAAQEGYFDVFNALLKANADVNIGVDDGHTALMIALQNGHREVVEALLATKAEVNAKTNEGVTAVMVAAQNGDLNFVKALLAAGAGVNAKTNEGVTALMVAAQNGHLEVVEALLDANADRDARTDSGDTAGSLAMAGGFREIVGVLIASDARR